MKRLLLTALLSGTAVAANAQGFLALQNSDNAGASPPPTSTSTSGGLFYFNGSPIAQDFNVVFMMGPASGPTTTVSFIGSAAVGDNIAGPGTFYDVSGNSYAVPGVPNGSCTMTIQAWLGSATSYASATTKGTATYQQRLADPTVTPPPTAPSLVDMPSIVLSGAAQVPEPSTFALAGLGAAALLIFRRRK